MLASPLARRRRGLGARALPQLKDPNLRRLVRLRLLSLWHAGHLELCGCLRTEEVDRPRRVLKRCREQHHRVLAGERPQAAEERRDNLRRA